MKTVFFTPIIAVFLFCCTNGVQAQSSQPKLNQVELMKQFLGSWKCDVSKDTVCFTDLKQYGTGFEVDVRYVSKGKIIRESKQILGYDKGIDKYIGLQVTKGMGIYLYAIWFTSETNYESVHYSDISNPDKASFRSVGEFKSPDLELETAIIDNKPVKTEIWTRVK